VTVERFWIDAEGPNRDAISRACEWMMSGLSAGSVGLLVVPTKAALTGVFAEEQPTLARTLERQGKTTSGGVTIVLMTEHKGPEIHANGPALVLRATMDLLNAVEATQGVTKILAVPWVRTDIDLWLNTWAPRKIPIPPPSTR